MFICNIYTKTPQEQKVYDTTAAVARVTVFSTLFFSGLFALNSMPCSRDLKSGVSSILCLSYFAYLTAETLIFLACHDTGFRGGVQDSQRRSRGSNVVARQGQPRRNPRKVVVVVTEEKEDNVGDTRPASVSGTQTGRVHEERGKKPPKPNPNVTVVEKEPCRPQPKVKTVGTGPATVSGTQTVSHHEERDGGGFDDHWGGGDRHSQPPGSPSLKSPSSPATVTGAETGRKHEKRKSDDGQTNYWGKG